METSEEFTRRMKAQARRDLKITAVGGVMGLVTFALLVWVAVLTGIWQTMEDVGIVTAVVGPLFVLGGVVAAHSIYQAGRH